MKTTSLLIITVSALLLISGCSKQQSSAPTQGGNAPGTGGTPPPMGAQAPSGSEAGLTWTTPSHWQMGEEKPMRVATYIAGEAECAVYYFGPGEGGDVESNLERWYGQFKQPDGSETAKRAKRETRQINGIQVTVVDIPGTYTSPGGPMMTSQGEKPNYRMLGAIAEGPNGNVFFKFVGPEATIAKEKKHFDALLNSLKKSS